MQEYTIEQLLKFFKTQFIAIDNIPENTTRRDSICMEARASILLDNAPLGELSRFFQINKAGNQLYLELQTPLSTEVSYENPFPGNIFYKAKWQFKKYVIFPTWGKKDCLGQCGR